MHTRIYPLPHIQRKEVYILTILLIVVGANESAAAAAASLGWTTSRAQDDKSTKHDSVATAKTVSEVGREGVSYQRTY